MASRESKHETESKSRIIFESAIADHGDMLFRTMSERDYGIDGIVELFNNGDTTGRIAHVQLKSTSNTIEKLKTADAVSCSGITKSNLGYCRQNNIPVMLVYVSTANGKFYYIDLQSVYQGKIEEIADNSTGTVRIPVENNSDDLNRLVFIINSYYERDEGHLMSNRQNKSLVRDSDSELINSYEFHLFDSPADGEHKEIGANGGVIAVGCWKEATLQNGTEFNFLIKVTDGQLIYKPNCPEDPYDSTENFKYDKLEQYGWYEEEVFSVARYYIIEDGMENYYVVDFDVTETTEQMRNIRTLKEFLTEKEPEWLKELEEDMANTR